MTLDNKCFTPADHCLPISFYKWDPKAIPALQIEHRDTESHRLTTIKIWHDGRIEWQGCEPDEAALLFARYLPDAIKKAAYEHFSQTGADA